MKFIVWCLRLVVFLAVLAFALGNQHPVELHIAPGASWHTPLIWVITAAFVLGTLFGVAAMLPVWLGARKRAKQQTQQPGQQATHPDANPKRQLTTSTHSLATPPNTSVTNTLPTSTSKHPVTHSPSHSPKAVPSDELGI